LLDCIGSAGIEVDCSSDGGASSSLRTVSDPHSRSGCLKSPDGSDPEDTRNTSTVDREDDAVSAGFSAVYSAEFTEICRVTIVVVFRVSGTFDACFFIGLINL